VDESGTWGIPGGAIHDGESPEEAAHRETAEEIWPVRLTVSRESKFHIVCADVDEPFTAYIARKTDATGWFTLQEMSALRLHPGFPPVGERTDAAGCVDPRPTLLASGYR
jgi:8-oxo-dGTP diphosphatase